MASLDWCKKQNKGIKLIEPNKNLSDEYLANSMETLSLLKDIEKVKHVACNYKIFL